MQNKLAHELVGRFLKNLFNEVLTIHYTLHYVKLKAEK